jgi:PTH1 family peptidyl-tRNA hydrolase
LRGEHRDPEASGGAPQVSTAALPFLVLGLGNPGPEYAWTRHNLGFMVLDELSSRHKIPVQERTRLALTGTGTLRGLPVVLAKPRTYMNLSGQAAQSLAARLQIPPSRILALVDDFTIPLGRVRVRREGGTGGHNGLASLMECLGTRSFPRIRLGIGPLAPDRDPADFVLEEFRADETEAVRDLVLRGADAVESWMEEGIEAAMNRFNGCD